MLSHTSLLDAVAFSMSSDVQTFCSAPGVLAHPDFDALRAMSALETARVLVVGAGGLGCELLKNLALSGFGDIHVMDMDTIDVTNLNRQFLFRDADVGKPKAVVAAEFVNRRVPRGRVTPYFARIEAFDEDFYAGFAAIVSGLDAIEPRRWLNSMVYTIFQRTGKSIPLIDGGTEGMQGNVRVIVPGTSTPCFECTLYMFPQARQTFPLCTIKNTPRLPEHVVQYVAVLQWGAERKGESLDGDSPEHVQWVLERSLERARVFGISGVTRRLAQGVVKNIIPALASTNAIVSGMCANEVFKILTKTSFELSNYSMINGEAGMYQHTFANEKNPECLVCGIPTEISVDAQSCTIRDLIRAVARRFHLLAETEDEHGTENVRIESAPQDCAVAIGVVGPDGRPVFMPRPASLLEATRANLSMPTGALIDDGVLVSCSHPAVPFTFRVRVRHAAASSSRIDGGCH